MRLRQLVLPLLAAGLLLPPAAAADTIIVKRAPGLDAGERAELRADAGVKLVEPLAAPRTELVAAPAGRADEALAALEADRDVVYATPNHAVRGFGVDAFMTDLWGLENTGQEIGGYFGVLDADLDAPEAWAASTGAGAKVAVVDSGVLSTHADLAGRLSLGWDYVQNDGDPQDANGHGTHVTGTIVANRNNDIGVAGVAPGATAQVFRVLNASGQGSVAAVADAFRAAAASGTRIVNASLGAEESSAYEYEAIQDFPNTLFVVAAGNGGDDHVGDDNDVTPTYPCAHPLPNVLCVGALDNEDVPTSFSNYGATTVDVFAPGYDILSTDRQGGYDWMDGTSMASPHVAGVAALLLAREPSLTAVELKQRILASVDPVAALDGKSVTGGRVNAAAALASTYQEPDPPVVDPPVVQPPVTPPTGDGGRTTPVADRDKDGRDDASDGCPAEAAKSRDGCPLPGVRALSATARKRTVTVRVRTSRAAQVRITVERRRCKRKRCRWARVARRTQATRGNGARMTVRRLRAGRHRAVVVLSSSAGTAAAVAKPFRVR